MTAPTIPHGTIPILVRRFYAQSPWQRARKGRPGMRHTIRMLGLIVAVVCMLGKALRVSADELIKVVDNRYQVQFSESIGFDLQVDSSRDLNEVTLYYRKVGEGLSVKVPLAVSAGQSSFSYVWDLEPGEVPVGARLEYDWHVADVAGDELRTSATAFTYDDDRFEWQVASGSSIRLFWYGSSEEDAERLLDYAVEALARLQDEMGVVVEQPVHIYVYRSKQDMAPALPRSSDAYDDRILTLGVVVDEATLLLLGPHPDVEGTIAHELSHIVVGLATDNPYAELPRWLDEGLAMYSEGQLPDGNRRALQAAIDADSLISVRSLSGYTGDPSQVNLFYGEVHSLIEFMLETHGKEKMADLLAAIREGLYQEDALERVYGFGLDELDSRWRASLGLSPRGTSAPPVPQTQPNAERRSFPCSIALMGGLIGVPVAAWGRKRARAS